MSVFILKSDVQNTIRKEKTDRYIQLHFKSPQSQSPQLNHNKMKHTPWFSAIFTAYVQRILIV